MGQLRIKIVGERLPGLVVGEHQNVHIGVQRGDDVVDLVAGDAPVARFDISIVSREGDFRSPYVHGKKGDRFLYLVWVDVDGSSGEAVRFGRVKVMLSAIPAGLLRDDTTELEAYLPLTEANGKLVFASVRPPKVTWTSS